MSTLKNTFIGWMFLILCAAGCGGGSDLDTLGDVFIEIGEALCDRAVDCGLFTSGDRDECESELQGAICGQVNCGEDFEGKESDVDECIDDIDDLDCAELGGEDIPIPASCMGLQPAG